MEPQTQSNPRFWWAPHWLTLLSGILIVLSFPPWNLWPLIWVCLIPWFMALKKAHTLRESLAQGLWLSSFMTLGGFYWISYALMEFGNLPWVISIVLLQLFSYFGQPQFILFALVFKTIESKMESRQENLAAWKALTTPIFLALFYTGLDWATPKLFVDTLGHAFYKAQSLRQLADLGGASLLTFLVYLTNDAFWKTLEEAKKNHKFKVQPQVILSFLLISMGWLYGHFRYQQINDLVNRSSNGIQAAAIQANIGDFDKIAAERGVSGAATRILDIFTDMSNQALKMEPKPEFLIWPETSYPATFRNPHSLTEMQLDERVESYVHQSQTPLLFGGYDHVDNHDYNAFFFLNRNGELQTYRKSILLLFGEYIPGAETFQFIKDLFPQVGNFGRGKGPEALELPTSQPKNPFVKVGPMICYEGLFSQYAIDSARKGSQFLLNVTNDSWFGNWGEPQLHLALTVFRSIETRLPLLRSTNTGITALILPDGEISNSTEINSVKIVNVHVPITDPIPTLIKLWGDWFGWFAFGTGMLGLILLEISFLPSLFRQMSKMWSISTLGMAKKSNKIHD